MADNPVVIAGSLSTDELEKSINEIVQAVDTGMTDVAKKFDDKLGDINTKVEAFSKNITSMAKTIKDSFGDMGGSFDKLAEAINKVSQAKVNAGGIGSGNGGNGGSGGGANGGGDSEFDDNTIGALKEEIKLLKHKLDYEYLNTNELNEQVKILTNKQNLLKEQTTSQATKNLQDALGLSVRDLDDAEFKLEKLNDVRRRYANSTNLSAQEELRLKKAIEQTQKQVEKFRQAKPKSLKDVLGMDEKSVDDITKKMRELRRVQIDPKNAKDVNKLSTEYQRLVTLQNQLLGKNATLIRSNDALARSFNYIRNRVVYALTIGSVTSFVKQIYDVRAQYELLERSLGVLVNSFSRGKQIFQELNEMAIRSPFTLIELGTAAKQLTAYNFAADEVVNTTKRLADISSALGVPMERLTYNLGQIRAQTVLTARDARDFANAGLPIVQALADRYTELEGKVVSTGDVFDRMKKRAVSYNDVMSVLNEMTDEGGRFFDFQAKQAETLKVQLANLHLAWNNMLNDIGKEHQSLLQAPLTILKKLFQNWQDVSHIITEVVVGLGAYKAIQMVMNRLMGQSASQLNKFILSNKRKIATDLEAKAVTTKLTATEKKLIATKNSVVAKDYMAVLSTKNLTKAQAQLLVAYNKNNVELTKAIVKLGLLKNVEVQAITRTNALANAFKILWANIKEAFASIGATLKNPATWAMVAVGLATEAIMTWNDISDAIKQTNKNIVDSAKESRESIESMLNDYSEIRNRLSKGEKPSESESVKTWKRIKEEIQNSSAASTTFINRLETIGDINQRITKGFDYLQMIHDVNGGLEQISEKAIDINGDWSKWWNLWAGSDGLIDNLKDYVSTLEDGVKVYGSLERYRAIDAQYRRGGTSTELSRDEGRFMSDLNETTKSMINAFQTVGIEGGKEMREAFARSTQQILVNANLDAKQRLQFNINAEQDFINERIKMFDEERDYELSQGNAQRAKMVENNKQAWLQSFGGARATSDAFFEWLKNQHASEITKMFGTLTYKERETLDISEQRWQKWAIDNAKSFSGQMNISLDSLESALKDKDRWKLFIQTFFTADGSIYDAVTQADKDLQDAQGRKKRLEQLKQDLINKGEALSDDYLKTLNEIDKANKDIEDAKSRHGRDKETKGGAKKDPILDSLKQEISLVEKLQGDYEKLTKVGATSAEALETIHIAYGSTIELLNKNLNGLNLPTISMDLFTGKDPHAQLEFFKGVLKDLKSGGLDNLERIKALEGVIEKLNVKVKSYDLDMVTKGLNNELGKLKEEYELGIEFDANPELGDVFADMIGIDREELNKLPKTYSQLAKKMQEAIDNEFAKNNIVGGFDLVKMLNKGDFDRWCKERGNELDSAFVDALNKIREQMNKVRMDEAKETIQNWSNLVGKYGSIQDRLVKIYKETVKEQLDVVKEFGDSSEIEEAMNLANRINLSSSPEQISRLQKELNALVKKVSEGKGAAISINTAIEKGSKKSQAKAIWDDFKNSDQYTKLFDNLSYLSVESLQRLLDKLDEVKEKVKEDPASMKAVFEQIENVRNALIEIDPARGMAQGFQSLMQGMKEFTANGNAIQKTAKYIELLKKQLQDARSEVLSAARELEDATASGNEEERLKAQEKLNQAKQKEKQTNKQLKDEEEKQKGLLEQQAETTKKIRKGLGDVANSARKWGDKLGNVSDALGSIGSIFSELGDEETAEAVNDMTKGFQIMIGVLGAVAAACVVVQLSLGAIYLVAMAIAGVFLGLAFLFEGSANRAINRQIKESEANVRKLENAYKDLEAAIRSAYGAEEYGLKQAEIANKKLQLAEMKRQLELERSRSGKHYDQEKVDEYIGKVKDLENEIAEMLDDVVNDMLGISSVGNAAEELVSSMIDAFRKGEDYMVSYGETFDKMVNNMIIKAIASRVIGDRLQEIWDTLDARVNARTQDAQSKIDYYTNKIVEDEKMYDKIAQAYNNMPFVDKEKRDEVLSKIKQMWENDKKALEEATKAAAEAGQLTPEDVDEIRNMANNFKGDVKKEFEAWMEAFGIEFGESAEGEKLSNLQQGIQGITEDTAGALEGMLNGISQQIYMHSDILVEIKDTLHTMDFDVHIDLQSQMLLQLQNGYQTMNAMRTMMENWQTPSGNGIRVEML